MPQSRQRYEDKHGKYSPNGYKNTGMYTNLTRLRVISLLLLLFVLGILLLGLGLGLGIRVLVHQFMPHRFQEPFILLVGGISGRASRMLVP